MESVKEYLHIDLEWSKNPYRKRTWDLKFDDELICTITQGGFFFRKLHYVQSKAGKWVIKRVGRDPYLYQVKNKVVVSPNLFQIGFKKKHKEGMFNPTKADSFLWKKLEGKAKGMAWFYDGLEAVRFEYIKRTGKDKLNFRTSVIKGDLEEKWLAAMIIVGFIAMRG